jgi:dTDP-4-amino-4,6-dideoxygalactose transaminase
MKIEIYSLNNIREDLMKISRLFESSDTLGGINSRHIKSLEDKFKRITDKESVFVSSCTNGIYLALKRLNLDNEYVVVSPITFFGIISAIVKAGGIPLYSRVDKYGLMDLASVDELCSTYKVRAIIPSHINNRCVDTRNLETTVIEDSAPAYGIKRDDGTSVLDTKHTSVLSFSYGKPLTAGEGGMILLSTEDSLWYRGQRFCGLITDGTYGYSSFDVAEPELKLTNTSISAAIISMKLKSFNAEQIKNLKIAQYYDQHFGRYIDSQLNINGNNQTFVILSNRRDEIKTRLAENNIMSYMSHRPVYLNTSFSKFVGSDHYDKTSEEYFKNILHIPCRTDLTDEQVMLIADVIKRTLT